LHPNHGASNPPFSPIVTPIISKTTFISVFVLLFAAGCTLREREGEVPADTVAGSGSGEAPAGEPIASASPPHRPRSTPADTTAIIATPDELDELRRDISIPVPGVRVEDLRDSYDEFRGTRIHSAIDIAAPRGTPVLSATSGRVLKRHESVAGGLMLYAADSTDRFILMYGHLDGYAPDVTEGMRLRRGQLLAYVGTSGNAASDTPHLHFAIARGRPGFTWWLGTPVNPFPLLSSGPR
jgi:peptidoglycan LD-endopeptidase LytH